VPGFLGRNYLTVEQNERPFFVCNLVHVSHVTDAGVPRERLPRELRKRGQRLVETGRCRKNGDSLIDRFDDFDVFDSHRGDLERVLVEDDEGCQVAGFEGAPGVLFVISCSASAWCLTFGLTFPIALIVASLPRQNAVHRRLRDGAADLRRSVDQILSSQRTRILDGNPMAGLHPEPSEMAPG
jgi:hypothetical protein